MANISGLKSVGKLSLARKHLHLQRDWRNVLIGSSAKWTSISLKWTFSCHSRIVTIIHQWDFGCTATIWELKIKKKKIIWNQSLKRRHKHIYNKKDLTCWNTSQSVLSWIFQMYWLLQLTWSLNSPFPLCFFSFTAGCKGTISVWSHLPPPEPTRKRLFWHQICGPRQAAGMILGMNEF